MLHQEPSRIENLESNLGISLKSLVKLVTYLILLMIVLGWVYIGFPLRMEADIHDSPLLTKKATITRVDREGSYRKEFIMLDLGNGVMAQTNSRDNFQVGEKVIANCKIGKSGRYYVEDIQPIQKLKRKVLLP